MELSPDDLVAPKLSAFRLFGGRRSDPKSSWDRLVPISRLGLKHHRVLGGPIREPEERQGHTERVPDYSNLSK
jgi:hypothetical protein